MNTKKHKNKIYKAFKYYAKSVENCTPTDKFPPDIPLYWAYVWMLAVNFGDDPNYIVNVTDKEIFNVLYDEFFRPDQPFAKLPLLWSRGTLSDWVSDWMIEEDLMEEVWCRCDDEEEMRAWNASFGIPTDRKSWSVRDYISNNEIDVAATLRSLIADKNEDSDILRMLVEQLEIKDRG